MAKLKHFAGTKRAGLPARARIARAKARNDMRRSKKNSGGMMQRSVAAARSARGGY